ncbi:calcium uptake protein 1 homolog, mitochondrial-like isoform X2 [Bactrocera neohumeralis]|uniref:calcium uptake protein 1 homolog, mitochondrial-like isoform X2 n=1 Tax=Bactrocera neohumeralis TaxID=98809 RepID=UPI002165544E|nr:calcium uptake protein 1 homolog, mitochondrial-like isoform X2 [Bactrocera neohumeralis]
MSLLRHCGASLRRQNGVQQLLVKSLTIGGGQRNFNQLLLQPAPSTTNKVDSVRGYKKFGHKEEPTPRLTRYFHVFVGTLFFITILDWKRLKRALMPKVDADAPKPKDIPQKNKVKNNNDSDAEESDGKDEPAICKERRSVKEKMGFRERKIIEYENRIRAYSTPDKIFRYFATVRLTTATSTEVCMTPDDFLRSIYPGMMQPEGLGLDQYRRYDPKVAGEDVAECLKLHLAKDSIFYKLGSFGLITFSDYIFLLTVLSTSRRHFEIAFQMFDLNGDGDVDSEEFEMVADLVRQQSTIGIRHRDHAATGNTFKGVNSALTHYFFGPNLDQKLTIQKFIQFQAQLQREILTLEFERKTPNSEGLITEVDFAELLVAYAGYSHKKKSRKLKRVKRKFKDNNLGISKKDYLDFFHFLNNINDVDTALTFYHIAGASIDQATLKHVAKTVAMVDLRDHVIDVIFTIFDEDNDNQLSNREFVAVMKNRLQRGLEKSKDTGFIKMMRSMLKCAKETKPVLLDL